MTAIITSQFRLDMAKKLIADIGDTNSGYYLFVGRSETWSDPNDNTIDDTKPSVPYDNEYSTLFEAYQMMHGLKRFGADDVQWATPRTQWISGTTYVQYDDQDGSLESKKYYVITDNNHVYMCLKAGSGASSTNPDTVGVQTANVIDFSSSDGYIWKYMYSLSIDAATKFLTSSFVPVDYITSQPAGTADAALKNQWEVQSNAIDGAIYNIVVTAEGTYTSAPTVTVHGDGSGCDATAVMKTNNTKIDYIKLDNYTSQTAGIGKDYTQAHVEITGGGGSGGGAARVVLGPVGGFGADPRHDLRSHYVTINVNLQYDVSGDFVIDQDFRQIGIIRNPFNHGTTTVATSDSLNALRTIVVGSPASGDYLADDEIEGTNSGAHGIVDHYNSTNGTIRYHQTPATGFKSFGAASPETIKKVGGSITRTVASKGNPEVDRYSGEVIFLENRTPVTKAADQIETIKIVVEL